MEKFRNILLVQFGDIGDVVLTTPAIHAVREFCPEARVSILVHKPFGELLKADPNIHEVLEFAKVKGSGFHVLREYLKFIRRLRRARYDLVIDLRTGDRGAFFSFLTGATERIGYRGDDKKFWHSILFTKIVRELPSKSVSDHPGANQSLRMLKVAGIDAKGHLPKLFVSQDDRARAELFLSECGMEPGGRCITINPFSRWKYKEWGSEKWSQVIDRIWEEFSIPSLLIGSQEESFAASVIVKQCKGHAFNLAGKTTLGELTAVMSMSSLHLGVDSAAPHIAAALGVPTATIHGPSDWRSWRVVDDLHLIVAPTMECVPCSRRGCDDTEVSRCLNQLKTETVVEVIKSLLCKILD